MRVRWWSFLGTVLAYAAAASWAAVSGPDPFPTHFGLSGQPDSWTPRAEAVSLHAGIAAGIAVLFAGLALLAFGSGPVRGFAVVHCLGILTSMFSAVFFSRGLVNLWYGGRKRLKSVAIGQIWKPEGADAGMPAKLG